MLERNFSVVKTFILFSFSWDKNQEFGESSQQPSPIFGAFKMKDFITKRWILTVSIATNFIVKSDLSRLRSNSESTFLINSHCVKLGISWVSFHELSTLFYPGIDFINCIFTDGLECIRIVSISKLRFRMNINQSTLFVNFIFIDKFLFVQVVVIKFTISSDCHYFIIIVVK